MKYTYNDLMADLARVSKAKEVKEIKEPLPIAEKVKAEKPSLAVEEAQVEVSLPAIEESFCAAEEAEIEEDESLEESKSKYNYKPKAKAAK